MVGVILFGRENTILWAISHHAPLFSGNLNNFSLVIEPPERFRRPILRGRH
jgi:hypothetical protein